MRRGSVGGASGAMTTSISCGSQPAFLVLQKPCRPHSCRNPRCRRRGSPCHPAGRPCMARGPASPVNGCGCHTASGMARSATTTSLATQVRSKSGSRQVWWLCWRPCPLPRLRLWSTRAPTPQVRPSPATRPRILQSPGRSPCWPRCPSCPLRRPVRPPSLHQGRRSGAASCRPRGPGRWSSRHGRRRRRRCRPRARCSTASASASRARGSGSRRAAPTGRGAAGATCARMAR
mmetsp:Transcript_25202/g.72657  ORF Transcript_25202/g.72657 Transcript_25202/m.72657 type:complete len:233 (-) Transcript_25202:162-860(-)